MELYKYMSAEKFETHIINGPTIRFTPPWEFNDPFEFFPAVKGCYDINVVVDKAAEIFESHAAKRAEELDLNNETRNRLEEKKADIINKSIEKTIIASSRQEYFRNIFKGIGVFSATSEKNNILMWSHYADSHKGVALIIDKENSFFNFSITVNIDNNKYEMYKFKFENVTYENNRPERYIDKKLSRKIFYTKYTCWNYEKEYRYVTLLHNDMPYQWKDIGKGVCSLPKDVIKGVIFGCMCTDEQIEGWRRQLADKGGFEHLKFYKAEMDKLEYKLNIVPLA